MLLVFLLVIENLGYLSIFTVFVHALVAFTHNSKRAVEPRKIFIMPGHYIWVIDQVCSVKTAGYWPRSFFACSSRSINSGSLERARWLHLARSGSQSHLAIWCILPARGASRIIKENNAPSAANQIARTHVAI